jgi:hypothetical protein
VFGCVRAKKTALSESIKPLKQLPRSRRDS